MYEVQFLNLCKITAKGQLAGPELWLYNEFPGRCTIMSKASESCIISEAEGF